jgi:hypothetical protein
MGKIELDHTGSGGGVTLSSDGADLLLDGTAVGGSPDLYADNYNGTSTKPSATGTNAIAMGQNAVASGTDSFAIGRAATSSGSYGISYGLAATASGNGSTSLGYSSDATGTYSTACGYSAQAQNDYANAFGYQSFATGAGSTAFKSSRASGVESVAIAIQNINTIYGASGTGSIAIGDRARSTSGDSVAIGNFAYADNNHTFALGYRAQADQEYSVAIGQDAYSFIYGKHSQASGRFSSTGDANSGTFILRSDTTDATPEALTTDNGTAGTTNQIILPNNSAYAFHGTIVARQQASAGTASAAWKVEGLIRREGSAGTTVLVNSATTVLDNTPSWGLALSADTTNGGLAITVTGAASTNIRWVSTIHTSEVTYA